MSENVKINNYYETAGTENYGIYCGNDKWNRPVFISVRRRVVLE